MRYYSVEKAAELSGFHPNTISWNGKIKKIGGAKFIKDDGVVVDRDYNGARGIFLRGLCEIQPSLEDE